MIMKKSKIWNQGLTKRICLWCRISYWYKKDYYPLCNNCDLYAYAKKI